MTEITTFVNNIMAYYRYYKLRKYINGEPTDVYSQGERADDVIYNDYNSCMQSSGTMTRWIDTPSTICVGNDEYRLQQEQVSYNGGSTWQATGNTRQGSLVQQNALKCMGKATLSYLNGDTYQIPYNGSGSIDMFEVNRNISDTSDSHYITNITGVTLSSGVTSIAQMAFQGCTGLTSVNIPSTVTSIGNNAFNGCTGLTTLTLSNGVTTVSSSAFYGCTSLTSVTIPYTCTTIDTDAFRNCTGLVSITVNSSTPPSLGVYAFDNTNDAPIFVPCEAVSAYRSATHWADYSTRIQCTTVQTRWVADTGYVCVGTSKYDREKEQTSTDGGLTWQDTGNTRQGSTLIETDSYDCGYVSYRWVADTGYVCDGYDKYNREKEQSTSDGTNWVDTGNTRKGSTLIEANSTDCGYVPPTPPSNNYLTINSLENNNTISWVAYHSSNAKTVQVSTDNGTTWNSYTSSTGTGTVLATLNQGDKLLVKGSNTSYNNSNHESNKFTSTGRFNLSGNIMSLNYGDNFTGQTSFPSGSSYTFASLFIGNSGLVSAQNLILPATTLADSCYQDMFNGCTSLTTAPELPATTLTDWCYSGMFNGCTSLTTAPDLPATFLMDYSYYFMFANCSSLNYIKCLATQDYGILCTYQWVSNVAATGTFVKAASMTDWTTGVNGIPANWTVQDAS